MRPRPLRVRTMSGGSYRHLTLRSGSAVALSATLYRALSAAAERVADSLAERSGQPGPDPRSKMARVSQAICLCAEGDRSAIAADGPAVCSRELLDALRVELLARLNE